MKWVEFAQRAVAIHERSRNADPGCAVDSRCCGKPRDEAQVCTSPLIGQENKKLRDRAGAHFLYFLLFLPW